MLGPLGNGGVDTAAADGGAVTIGDIDEGGNAESGVGVDDEESRVAAASQGPVPRHGAGAVGLRRKRPRQWARAQTPVPLPPDLPGRVLARPGYWARSSQLARSRLAQ